MYNVTELITNHNSQFYCSVNNFLTLTNPKEKEMDVSSNNLHKKYTRTEKWYE